MLRRMAIALALAAAVGCTDTSDNGENDAADGVADTGTDPSLVEPAAAQSPEPALTPVPCPGNPKDSQDITVGPRGGRHVVLNGRVALTYPKQAYGSNTPVTVTVTPAPDQHGVRLDPAPTKPILLAMLLGECADNDKDGLGTYSFVATADGVYPAAVVDQAAGNSERSWSTGAVPPDAWTARGQAPTSTDTFTGFVILSN